MTSPRRLRSMALAFPYSSAAVGVCVFLYLYVAAATIATSQGDIGSIGWVKVIGFAFAPICVFCALRYPVIFPFGLYIVLTPFDSLLDVAGSTILVRLIGFAVLGALGLRMLRLRTVYVPQKAWYFWLALVSYAALSVLWSVDIDSSLKVMSSVSMLFVLMTLLATYPVTLKEFKVILGFAVAASIVAGIVCLKQYASGAYTNELAPRLELAQNGFMIDVNYMGGSFIVPVALSLAGLFFSKNVAVKAVCAVAVILSIAAISVNASRESLIAVAIIFLFFVIRSKNRFAAIGFGVASLSTAALFPSIITRLFESQNMSDGSGRTEIWKAAMHTFGDHWLFGTGAGSFQEVYDHNLLQVTMQNFPGWHRPGHSLIFESLNDYGVLGFSLVVACWFMSFRQLSAIPKDHVLYPYRVGVEAAIVGISVLALFIDPFYIKFIWFGHSLALMLLNVYNPRRIGFGRHLGTDFGRFRSARFARGG